MFRHMLSNDRGAKALEYGLTGGLVLLASALATLSALLV